MLSKDLRDLPTVESLGSADRWHGNCMDISYLSQVLRWRLTSTLSLSKENPKCEIVLSS